jgi:hypothetical protein
VRTVLLYHTDPIQDLKADLIASQFPVDAFVHVHQRRAPAAAYLWRRFKRFGFSKVADEVLWRMAYRLTEYQQDQASERELILSMRRHLPASYQRPPVQTLESINSPDAERLLRQLNADVCIIMLNVMVKKHIFTIPRHGMLIFHPGLVPEYRGVHCGMWAVANGEADKIGWTLLRIDEGVDTGPVLAQGICLTGDPARENYQILQHRAQFDGVPGVVNALQRLAAGETPSVDLGTRTPGHFTHPGFSDFLRYRRMLGRFRSLHRGTAPMESEGR